LDRFAEKAGYKLIIRFSYGKREKETNEINFLMSLNVTGLIIMPSHGDHYSKAILKLYLDGFPFIMIDKKLKGIPVASVRTDNINAVSGLVQQLYNDGCRNIALFISGDQEAVSILERKHGYKLTMAGLGLNILEPCVVTSDDDFLNSEPIENELSTIQDYWKAHPGLDGIICTEYGLVLPAVKALAGLGVTADKDVRLCSVDGDYLAPHGYVFEHMKQDEKTIAELALEKLLKRINGERLSSEDYLVQPLLKGRLNHNG
jgi:DNA-binding LacI/PurR family transcriptional regulator